MSLQSVNITSPTYQNERYHEYQELETNQIILFLHRTFLNKEYAISQLVQAWFHLCKAKKTL